MVQAVVSAAREADELAAAARRGGEVLAAGVGRVAGGAVPSPSGAASAPAARRYLLEVVVARALEPAGPIAPVTLGRARRLIAGGEVSVEGVAVGAALDPKMLVDAGAVVVHVY